MRMFISVTVVALSWAVGLINASAQTAEERWEAVKEAARAEGEVVVAGPAFPNLREKIVSTFEAETGISVRWRPLTLGPGPFIAQLSREVEAKKVQTDVYIGGSTNCYNMNERVNATVDMREVILDPEILDPSVWRHDELPVGRGGPNKAYHHWCALNTAEWVMGDLFVNTRYVNPEEITSWKDLLKPKYKGKIVAHDPQHPGGGRGTAAYLYQLFGEDFIRELFIEQEVTLHRSYVQPAEDLARGRAWIGIALVQAAVEPLRNQGLPLERVFPDDGPGLLTGGFSGIMKLTDSPNPNAGKVFINWWASKQGQKIAQCELQELSLRRDVAEIDCVPEWTRPRAGTNYLIHSYAPDHYFGSYADYIDSIPEIFE